MAMRGMSKFSDRSSVSREEANSRGEENKYVNITVAGRPVCANITGGEPGLLQTGSQAFLR